MLSRKTVTSVAAALMILVGTASAGLSAGSTVLDQVNDLAAKARSAGGSSGNVANPLIPGPAPLTKFSATGRLTETLDNGPCLNNPIAVSTCSGGGCSQLSLSGTLNGTGVGKSTLDICFTLLPSTSGGACLGNGLGIGTLTAASGSALNLSFAGNLCINDEDIPTVTLFLSSNLNFMVEGGSGKFASETGTGNMSISTILVNPTSTPYSGTGEIVMTGTVSKN
jgi:hypothetical protein